ncbi:LamG domain-containing protein, partial [Patescibacteria group bacterium]|nr:LamG domain-containing protein [Patescibacteria group bacterium]
SSIYSNYHYGGTSFRIGDGTSYYDFPHNFVMSDIWTHLVIIYNGSNWYAYQDGVQTATKSESFTIHTGTTYTYIGVIANTDTLSPYYFNGLIDEVRIYNYARTEEQIGQDYNFGLSTHFK